jgi:Ca-activated chloride channel family protein
LLVPDGPIPVVGSGGSAAKKKLAKEMPNVGFHLDASSKAAPPGLKQEGGGAQAPVAEFLKKAQSKAGDGAGFRGAYNAFELNRVPMGDAKGDQILLSLQQARDRWNYYNDAQRELKQGNLGKVQEGKLGVDLSCDMANLRGQSRLTQTSQRWIGTRNCLEVGGVWIDEAYESSMKSVTVKAASDAYFKILERHPSVRNVFRISSHMVWVTPSGTALIIDTTTGSETMSDADIDALFVASTTKK